MYNAPYLNTFFFSVQLVTPSIFNIEMFKCQLAMSKQKLWSYLNTFVFSVQSSSHLVDVMSIGQA